MAEKSKNVATHFNKLLSFILFFNHSIYSASFVLFVFIVYVIVLPF